MAAEKQREPAHIVHKDKDLRLKGATPWQVAQSITRGKVQRKPKRPEQNG